ncbi:hypothetical protein NOW39_004381 [Vibrio parahaemolyticus]|uniref:hypothetical protein n=1 Tax=Vibrio TaxID=662 RepID=UPI0015F58EAE|nr:MULTISPECIES: hypothetical protein [Vibrio]EJE8570963.1 hypothetical protein [Vibrio vulnificus]EJM7154837.1 hypothetical protein [Vibrio parahaemolyticus]EKA5862203.1 hypothetical protein [Vibrio alginolyticus]CAE6925194.1 hypothetical protein ACOMICROBIO_LKFPLAJE_02927 [Vibrio sp. B1FIG11]
MANLIKTLNVEHDPRFLFDVSFEIRIDSNQDDIDARIMIAKDAVKKDSEGCLQTLKDKFVISNIAISEYDWIDTRDYVSTYFIWYCMLLVVRSNNKQDTEAKDISDFEVIFSPIAFDVLTGYVPKFPSDTSKWKEHTIIFLHYLFKEAGIQDAVAQQRAMNEIKNKYLDFKRSHFFKLTKEENKDRAEWTKNKLESDGAFLPFEIPASNNADNLSLAISLYLWNSRSPFKASIFDEEMNISKSAYVHKLNLSWNQYKHREKNKLKKVKAYSFEMEESLQKKIDHLSKALDMKKNRLIEYLIEQEYTKQTKK